MALKLALATKESEQVSCNTDVVKQTLQGEIKSVLRKGDLHCDVKKVKVNKNVYSVFQRLYKDALLRHGRKGDTHHLPGKSGHRSVTMDHLPMYGEGQAS